MKKETNITYVAQDVRSVGTPVSQQGHHSYAVYFDNNWKTPLNRSELSPRNSRSLLLVDVLLDALALGEGDEGLGAGADDEEVVEAGVDVN